MSSPEETEPFAALVWTFLTALFVLLMQVGFAMLEAGTVTRKSVLNILFKNIMDTVIACIAFWLFGYGIAYGKANNGFIGTTNYALVGNGFTNQDPSGYINFFSKWPFAAATATIVSGCVAERCELTAYYVYTFFVTGFIFPIVVCWCWGDGWLSPFGDPDKFLFNGVESNNFIDFAGSGVVHMVGGLSGLVGAIVIGPRSGRFMSDGSVNELNQHSKPIIALGTFILFVCWFAFNSGSADCSGEDCTKILAKSAVNTAISASMGAITVILTQRLFTDVINLVRLCNGLLAGLVSITASCSVVQPWAAAVEGIIGAIIYLACSQALLYFKIDDPLDASPVHGFVGIWGVLAVGIFGTDANAAASGYYGSAHGGHPFRTGEQFAIQLVGVAVIGGWTLIWATALFLTLHYTVGLRISETQESLGLDTTMHGDNVYQELQQFLREGDDNITSVPTIKRSMKGRLEDVD